MKAAAEEDRGIQEILTSVYMAQLIITSPGRSRCHSFVGKVQATRGANIVANYRKLYQITLVPQMFSLCSGDKLTRNEKSSPLASLTCLHFQTVCVGAHRCGNQHLNIPSQVLAPPSDIASRLPCFSALPLSRGKSNTDSV